MDLQDEEAYGDLKDKITNLCGTKIKHVMYYYSVWSMLYTFIAKGLHASGMLSVTDMRQTHCLEKSKSAQE